MQYQYRNYEKTIVAATDPQTGNVTILQPGFPGWDDLEGKDVELFTAEPDAGALEAERAGMEVSRFQARAALMAAGLLDDIEAMLAESGTPLEKMAWADALTFRRDSPTLNRMAELAGLDDAELDDLFRAAAGIRA